MKYALTSLISAMAVFFIATTLLGQGSKLIELEESSENQLPKTTTALSFGASYHTGFGGGSLFSQTASPFIRHRVSNRFSLFAGAEISLFQFSSRNLPLFSMNGTSLGTSPFLSNGFWGVSAFVGGEYKINENLSLFGSTWLNRNNLPFALGAGSFETVNNITKGVSMNLEYRVSNSFSIGAGFSVSDRRNPFNLQNGFGNFRNPFFLGPMW